VSIIGRVWNTSSRFPAKTGSQPESLVKLDFFRFFRKFASDESLDVTLAYLKGKDTLPALNESVGPESRRHERQLSNPALLFFLLLSQWKCGMLLLVAKMLGSWGQIP
jgi:hypothetical protein